MITRDAAAAKMTGTSLEALAPYLPYNIEVVLVSMPNEGFDYQLRSLSNFDAHQVAIGHRASNEFEWVQYKDILPVLHPFAQLVEPLADGTVPAVEVAKILLDLTPEHCEAGFLAGIHAETDFVGDIEVLDIEDEHLCWIYADWLIGALDTLVPLACHEYLRAKHFALPVNGRPLLEGQDYIAKTAASSLL